MKMIFFSLSLSLLAKLLQRETFYPVRAHRKVIDQNQNQNQTFRRSINVRGNT